MATLSTDRSGVDALNHQTLLKRFTDFSEMQTDLIERQPLVATVYLSAGLIFGFTNLFTLNPFVLARAGLTFLFGAAIAHRAYTQGGFSEIQALVSRAIAEAKALVQEKKGSEEPLRG